MAAQRVDERQSASAAPPHLCSHSHLTQEPCILLDYNFLPPELTAHYLRSMKLLTRELPAVPLLRSRSPLPSRPPASSPQPELQASGTWLSYRPRPSPYSIGTTTLVLYIRYLPVLLHLYSRQRPRLRSQSHDHLLGQIMEKRLRRSPSFRSFVPRRYSYFMLSTTVQDAWNCNPTKGPDSSSIPKRISIMDWCGTGSHNL